MKSSLKHWSFWEKDPYTPRLRASHWGGGGELAPTPLPKPSVSLDQSLPLHNFKMRNAAVTLTSNMVHLRPEVETLSKYFIHGNQNVFSTVKTHY